MRADRLLSLLLLLQGEGRTKARELARRLEVSERTVYRDLDALSAAGVPVFAERGPNGGAALVEGWRTSVTGLTGPEAQALAIGGVPRALSKLGLSEPLKSGLIKFAASLPALQQRAAEQARERLLIDVTPWFEPEEATPHVGVLRDAAWRDRRVRLRYRDFDGRSSERTVDPYALVVKLDRLYLVAGTAAGPTVFRVSRVAGARMLAQTFERLAGFDLRSFWAEWCRRFGERRSSYPVTLALTDAGAAALEASRPKADASLIARARRAGGRRRVTIDFEKRTIARSQLIGLAPEAEVLEPAELREELGAMAARLAATYGLSQGSR
jgi:predicted DNA-binding transcriptional regulator YafY